MKSREEERRTRTEDFCMAWHGMAWHGSGVRGREIGKEKGPIVSAKIKLVWMQSCVLYIKSRLDWLACFVW